jgi:nucleoside-diphosphate-sugar epimerase
MSLHVVVGAGPVGRETARLLAEQGHRVRLLSRRGPTPPHPGVESVAADAAEPAALARLARGADVLYNCANPPGYQHWARQWPPLAAALLQTAERTGALLATMSNLYGYGHPDGPLTEDSPLAATGPKGRLRARMWQDAEAAHHAGRLRAVEARAADYFGPAVLESSAGRLLVPRLLAGRPGITLGNPRAPHSWTYAPDAARALVLLAAREPAWGSAWHVPSHPPMTSWEFARALCEAAGAPAPRLRAVGTAPRRVIGLFSARVRAYEEIAHQGQLPFTMDSSALTHRFGMRPTPLQEAFRATAHWWRARAAAPDRAPDRAPAA